jgi:hypothetical protein
MFLLNLGNVTIRHGVTWLQAVTRRLLTAKDVFDLCGICVVQGGTGPSFLRGLRLCPVTIIPTVLHTLHFITDDNVVKLAKC